MRHIYGLIVIVFMFALGAIMETWFEPAPIHPHSYANCNHEIHLDYLQTRNGSIEDIGKGY